MTRIYFAWIGILPAVSWGPRFLLPVQGFLPLPGASHRSVPPSIRPPERALAGGPAASVSSDGERPATAAGTAAEPTNATIRIPRFASADAGDDDGADGYPSPLHAVRVESFLTDGEASRCLRLAQAHGRTKWMAPDRERHSNYHTCDFPISGDGNDGARDLRTYLEGTVQFQQRMWNRLSQSYGIAQDDLMGFLDLFCVRYVASNNHNDNDNTNEGAATTSSTMDRLESHRDGSILSFTVLLSPPDSFEGGGTCFEALRDAPTTGTDDILHPGGIVRPPRAGDAVLHCGKLLHGAHVVTGGERIVLVGFVEVADWCIGAGVLQDACTQWGRLDVAQHRLKHNDLRNNHNNNKRTGRLRPARNSKWLPRTSCFQANLPVLSKAILQHADPTYQRQKRLEAEDLMLRNILVQPPTQWKELLRSNDVTIL